MNIKLDENLPERLISPLQSLGHDVDTVRAERLAGREDTDIWQAAQLADRFLITQDSDFSDIRRYTPGTHAGLLLIRLARPARDALVARVSILFATESVEQWRGCLVVATDHKVRINSQVKVKMEMWVLVLCGRAKNAAPWSYGRLLEKNATRGIKQGRRVYTRPCLESPKWKFRCNQNLTPDRPSFRWFVGSVRRRAWA